MEVTSLLYIVGDEPQGSGYNGFAHSEKNPVMVKGCLPLEFEGAILRVSLQYHGGAV